MNIAICGFRHAHIGALYELVWRNPDARIVGFWEENNEARAEALKKIDAPVYETYEAMLADVDVDAVAVGDYYGIRGQRIIQALKAGKHVISDKPLATDMDELKAIEQISSDKGLKVACMLDLRYDPAVRLAQEIVSKGEIGEVHAVNFTGQHPLDYGNRPMWYFEKGKHGGTFNDIAIHGLDAITMITGLKKLTPIAVRQWNAFADQERHFKDCAQMIGKYENGAGVMCDVSYSVPSGVGYSLPTYWRFSIFGHLGMIEFTVGNASVLLAKKGTVKHAMAGEVTGDYLKDFMDEISGKQTTFATRDTLASSRLALEIQKAADDADW